MRILVLGVGNILLTDEAIGVRIVEALEQRYILPDYVEILDGGTAGMDEILDGGTAGMELLGGNGAAWRHGKSRSSDYCGCHCLEKERAGNDDDPAG